LKNSERGVEVSTIDEIDKDISTLYYQTTEVNFKSEWIHFADKYAPMHEFIDYMTKTWIGSDKTKAKYPSAHWTWYSHSLHPEWERETTNNIAERFMEDLKSGIKTMNNSIITVLSYLRDLLDFWTKEIQRLSQGIVKVRTKGKHLLYSIH
jgi:hypothetical protein